LTRPRRPLSLPSDRLFVHVLLVPSWYPTREAPLDGIYFAEQARCLDRRGLQVGVVFPEHQSLRRLSWDALTRNHFQTEWHREGGLPTLRRHGWNVWWRCPPGLRLRVRSAVRLARRYVDRRGVPDLVHAQSGRWAGAAAARIADHYSIPFALTEHFTGFQRNAIFPWRWSLIREGYRRADAISVVSTSLRQTLVENGLLSSSDAQMHPNLAPLSQFSLPVPRRSPPPPFRFVTIARLTPRKNVKGLLDALALQTGPATTLTVVGDGPQRSQLEQRAQALGINDRVQFRGMLGRTAVRDALWNAHAFVLSSLHETFGVVLLEAMATGLPVVATASGGPEDLVTPETGLLVPPGDTDALADALATLREERASYDADAIRAYVRDQFGPAAFVRRTRALYRRALHES